MYVLIVFKLTSIQKLVGMMVQNSTQTRVVGKITDKVHPMPYFE